MRVDAEPPTAEPPASEPPTSEPAASEPPTTGTRRPRGGPSTGRAARSSSRPPGEHYFSARPASAEERRRLTVHLAGREVQVETAGGVFSGEGLDLGTQVLLRSVPTPPPTGDLLDLGCGWGPIALTLGLLAPKAHVWAVDVNERALDLARANAARLGLAGVTATPPDGVPAGVRFAAIWSNPPIRIGKPALHALLETWLPRLAPGASAHLVVQRNLGADSLQTWLAGRWPGELDVEREASAKGFRVLRATAVRGA